MSINLVKYDRGESSVTFIGDLVSTFPEIKEEVFDEDWVGLIHLQVSCFTRYTQKAIDNDDILLALKCFEFVENNLNKVKSNVNNALVISWIFHLNFNNNEQLFLSFPEELKQIYLKYESYCNNASTNKKPNDFLKGLQSNTE